jgi:hypothetical protein
VANEKQSRLKAARVRDADSVTRMTGCLLDGENDTGVDAQKSVILRLPYRFFIFATL